MCARSSNGAALGVAIAVDELQRVVDGLARRLRRAVAIDDTHLRLLAYSAHEAEVDPVRTQAILTKAAPPGVVAYLRPFRIARAEGPIRIPANPELHMLARLCIPIRNRGIYFGQLWLIDAAGDLDAHDIQVATAAAAEAGQVLFREQVARELDRAREGSLVRDLLAEDTEVRALAAEALVEAGLFAATGGVAAAVVQPLAETDALQEEVRTCLSAVFTRLVSRLPRGECVTLVRPDHGLLLLRPGALDRHEWLLGDVQTETQALLEADPPVAVLVGIGETQPALTDAVKSYRQALQTCRVARVIPTFRPTARWSDLNVYALLVELPPDQLADDLLHPQLRAILKTDPALAETLELFLDHAGDTARVAAQLHTHRATVYSRIHRLEDLLHCDLSDGRTRLALHLALKLARLRGIT